ncbi:hypothetical protein RRSWK_00969 [Rhodopirellula sp. SWK7]|nr:hypothetical protein RRSWK_00969 [Rhodopirellula sp. SWK7]
MIPEPFASPNATTADCGQLRDASTGFSQPKSGDIRYLFLATL